MYTQPGQPVNAYGSYQTSYDPLIKEIARLEAELKIPRGIWSSKLFIFWILFLVLLLVLSGSFSGYLIYQALQTQTVEEILQFQPIEKQEPEPDLPSQLDLTGIDPQIEQELAFLSLENQLQTQAEDTDGAKFWSPSLGLQLNYQPSDFQLTELEGEVKVQWSQEQNFGSLYLIQKVDMDNNINDFLLSQYQGSGEFEVAQSSFGEVNQLHLKLAQTETQPFSNRKFYSREFETFYLVLGNVFTDEKELNQKDDQLTELIQSAKFKDLENTAQLQLAQSVFSLTYNLDQWQATSVEPLSASLVSRFQSQEQSVTLHTWVDFDPQITSTEELLNAWPQTKTLRDYQPNVPETPEFATEKHGVREFATYSYEVDGRYRQEYLFVVGNGLIWRYLIVADSGEAKAVAEARKILELINISPSKWDSSLSSLNTGNLLAKQALAKIYSQNCHTLSITQAEAQQHFPEDYEFCTTKLGTGFFLSPQGYVLTGADLAATEPLPAILESLSSPNLAKATSRQRLLTNFQKYLQKTGLVSTPLSQTELTERLKTQLQQWQENQELDLSTELNLVVEGQQSFTFESDSNLLTNASAHHAASKVDLAEENVGINLLKVEPQPDQAVLPVQSKVPTVGEQYQIVGFSQQADLAEEQTWLPKARPWHVPVKVTSVRENDQGVKVAEAQVPVAVHSGQPLVDYLGQVYGLVIDYDQMSQQATIVAAEDIFNLLEAKSIESTDSEASENLKTGLRYFPEGNYAKVSEAWQKVLEVAEDQSLALLVQVAKSKQALQVNSDTDREQTGESKSDTEGAAQDWQSQVDDIWQEVENNRWLYMGIGLATTFGLFILIVVSIWLAKGSLKAKRNRKITQLQNLHLQAQKMNHLG